MREKFFNLLARIYTKYPGKILILGAVVTIIFALLASRLEQTMRWSDLLPEKDKKTILFDKVIKEFDTSTSIVVVVQGEEKTMKAFADQVAVKIKNLTDPKDGKRYVKRIDYKQETEFIKKHGLMLTKEEDLKNMKDVFKNPNIVPLLTNINNSFEKEYIQKKESLSTREKEDKAFAFLDGIENFINTISGYISSKEISAKTIQGAADKLLTGEDYLLSYDSANNKCYSIFYDVGYG